MVLTLLTRILVWAAVGLVIWYVLLRLIPKSFLAWFGGIILLTVVVWSYINPSDETIGAVWNIISLPLTPLGFSLALMLFSFKEFSFKGDFKVSNSRYVLVAFLILFICSLPWVARFVVNQSEQAVRKAYEAQQQICADVCPVEVPETAPLGSIAAIVVLGENMDAATPPSELSSRADNEFGINPTLASRINSAGNLYSRIRQSGGAPTTFVTAGPIFGSSEEQTSKEAVLRRTIASDFGTDTGFRINDNGTNVHKTMREVRDFLVDNELVEADREDRTATLQRNASRVALVAPAISMRRAALTFEKEGLQVVAWPTNIYGSDVSTEDTLVLLSDLVPSVEALRLTTYYWNEVLISFYYFLRGWLPEFDVRWSEIVELVP